MTPGQDVRSLPSVDRLLQEKEIAALAAAYSHGAVANVVRAVLAQARSGEPTAQSALIYSDLVSRVLQRAKLTWRPWPGRVVNATGVILHTNLGRAPLSEKAIEAAALAAAGYTDLEFDLATGKRGSRYAQTGQLIAQVTGAESAIAVNNNASAALLTLSALSAGREVIVSRGEAVEIGGGFRVPDILKQSGATMVEVGTTNRTYARDYEGAVNANTAAILKVHPSNFLVTGFTHVPEISELVGIGRRLNVPVLYDLGSGCLLETMRYGLTHEPTVQECVSAGVNIIMFSGDKLLGGPQCGLIAGDASLVRTIEKHPLARAVRTDKVTLAALSATLLSYLMESAERDIPVWRMISSPPEQLRKRANRWKDDSKVGEVRSAFSAVGGGSLPGQEIPTYALALDNPQGGPDAFCAKLRGAQPPVIARIDDETVFLDPRTVQASEDQHVIHALIDASST